MTFNELNLHPTLIQAIKEANYVSPTPIQQSAIPIILQHHDLIACAQTGTGKTASYILPLLDLLLQSPVSDTGPQCLIVAPTRELVLQISASIDSYTKYNTITHATIFGGQSAINQRNQLNRKPQIIVATPGRLLEFLQNKWFSTKKIQHFVLDEADQMLDMGFVRDIRKIISFLPRKRQTLLFSATMPSEIEALAESILYKPKKVAIEKVSSPVKTVQQVVIHIEKQHKTTLLEQVLHENKDQRCIIFVRTKYGADKLVKQLSKKGLMSQAIHGNKSQNSRINTLAAFKKSELKVLIATDIAARGIDIEQLPVVINYELPQVAETYVHRIGRTGRAGNSGKAISFCSPEENKELYNIQKLIGRTIPTQSYDHAKI